MSSTDTQQAVAAPDKVEEITSATMDTDVEQSASADLLQRLPYEILTDVLMRLGSPKWVLAVARTNQYFCNTLLDEKSLGIWKANREAAGLPAPLPILTESSYAAFVFDGGPCEICKKETPNFYASFAIKLRLCNRTECRTEMRSHITTASGTLAGSAIMSWTPSMENYSWMGEAMSVSYWPEFRARLRAVDYRAAWQAFVRDKAEHQATSETLSAIDAITQKHAKDIEHNTLVMKFSVDLQLWRRRYTDIGQAVMASNHRFSRDLASREGYDYWDLCATETYKALLRHKTLVHERLTDTDANVHLPAVALDLARMRTRREHRAHEAQLRANRDALEGHHRGRCAREAMPAWATFCALPIVGQLLRQTEAGVNLAKAVRNQPLRGVLDAELAAWRRGVRRALCGKAGVADEVPVSSVRAHPVERVNVRFVCGRCRGVQRKYEYDESLDFAGVCAHECPTGSGGKRKRTEDTWNVDNFVYDEKASNAMTKLIDAAGLDASRKDCAESLKALGSQLLCKSCVPPLALHYSSVLGHAHRHDNMQIERVAAPEAMKQRRTPIVPGLTRALLNLHKPQGRLRQLSNAKEFSCQHCVNNPEGDAAGAEGAEGGVVCDRGCGRAFPSKRLLKKHWALHKNGGCADVAMGDAGSTSVTEAAPAEASAAASTAMTTAAPDAAASAPAPAEAKSATTLPPRMFNFNGIRSHLSEKHNIHSIRDEDYDCHRDAGEVKKMLQAEKEKHPANKAAARSSVAA
ncbi:hypothetical protein HDZ31DRAFT_43009 [Schizophyllum fasciatum]